MPWSLEELILTVDMLRQQYIMYGRGKRAWRRILYYDIMLIMLHNGLRINEARLCLIAWDKLHKRVVVIPALKTRRRSYRRCYIPEQISDYELNAIVNTFPINDPDRFRFMIHHFIKYNFGIKPHYIRKLFIDYMLDMGYDPIEVAKALGLMKVKTLEYYAYDRYLQRIREAHRQYEKLKNIYKPESVTE